MGEHYCKICRKYLDALNPHLIEVVDGVSEDKIRSFFAQHVWNDHFEEAKMKLSELIGCPFHN